MSPLKILSDVLLETFRSRKIVLSAIFAVLALGLGMAADVYLPMVFKRIVDLYSVDVIHSTGMILIAYSVIWTVSQTMRFVRDLFIAITEERGSAIISTKVFEHLYHLSLSYHLDQKTGAVISAVRRAQTNVPKIFWGLFAHIIPLIVELLIVLFILIGRYPLSIIAIFLGTFVLCIIYTTYVTKAALKIREEANSIDQYSDGKLVDWLLNFEAVKSFGMVDRAIDACRLVLGKRERAEVRSTICFELIGVGQRLILGGGLCLMTYKVGLAVIAKEMTMGDFVLINGYLMQFILPFTFFESVFRNVQKAFVDMKGIVKILDTKPKVEEKSNPIHLDDEMYGVEFKEVTFRHEGKTILDRVSFKVAPKSKVMIIGKTGEGKSTILRLLLRLYDVDEGQILINGIDIRDISFESLYQIVGIVPQETILFDETIGANIAFSKPGASFEEIQRAASLAEIAQFIESLPQKYETLVGERGLKLSGGEKQRIALARLFLRKNRLCLMDEPTSALDVVTEAAIERNIDEGFSESTKVIVTHRVSTIRDEDLVIFLEDGRIVERQKETVYS